MNDTEKLVFKAVQHHQPVTAAMLQQLISERVRAAVRNLVDEGHLTFNLQMELEVKS